MKQLFFLLATIWLSLQSMAQSCTPLGNETSFGTGNIWIGYVYDNINFTNYRGYVNEGNSMNPNFDQSFGGSEVSYPTNGCSVTTTTFSVRYKLRKDFVAGNYQITVGGDDGYRLSTDGGINWVINQWSDQSFASTTVNLSLSGIHDLIIEYYENAGSNRIRFELTQICNATENTAVYGTNNIWNAYVYDGTDFNAYMGMNHAGTTTSPAFDVNFGGSNVMYSTSYCSVQTETFSVRYRLRKDLVAGTYQFTVGGDDGYRLSLDGGTTWIINAWVAQSYAVRTSGALTLAAGQYDMVLEYYENSGDNRVTFNMQTLSILPVSAEWLKVSSANDNVALFWRLAGDDAAKSTTVERSTNGTSFETVAVISSTNASQYFFTDTRLKAMVYYYRLKVTDMNGAATFSEIKRVQLTSAPTDGISVYPTLVNNGRFSIKSSGVTNNATVTIKNLNGVVVFSQKMGKIAAGQITEINAPSLATVKGILIVSIISDQGISNSKILVQ